jgi:hypothetical protein
VLAQPYAICRRRRKKTYKNGFLVNVFAVNGDVAGAVSSYDLKTSVDAIAWQARQNSCTGAGRMHTNFRLWKSWSSQERVDTFPQKCHK